jgi:hypothetical protein
MANADRPFGAKPVGQNGGAFNGQVNRYYIPATDSTIMAVGDIVKLAGSADADGIPTVTRAAATNTPVGIIVGFDWPDRTYEDNPQYKPASVEAYALVADDPNVKFIIQEDGAIVAASVGLNTDILVANANSVTGQSQVELDSSEVNTTSTLVVRIESLYQVANNAIGTNAVWVCGFNVHQFGSVGVAGV